VINHDGERTGAVTAHFVKCALSLPEWLISSGWVTRNRLLERERLASTTAMAMADSLAFLVVPSRTRRFATSRC
jgi:hypothetical protein